MSQLTYVYLAYGFASLAFAFSVVIGWLKSRRLCKLFETISE